MKSWVFAAAVLAALPASADASVTWSFYETAIFLCNGQCSLPPQPFVLATLTLPSATSTGSASWNPGRFRPVPPGTPPPLHTGDDFTFALPTGGVFLMSPNNLVGPSGGPAVIDNYDISWVETSGNLDSIRIDILTVSIAEAHLGLSGGQIASDSEIGGCVFTQCHVSGFWQSDLPVPEPLSSAGLFLTGLFGTWLARRRYLSPRQFLGDQQRI